MFDFILEPIASWFGTTQLMILLATIVILLIINIIRG